MKYIIFGLGTFGASLAYKLTEQGNEVIGIDKNIDKVEALKGKISHTICLDSTDPVIVAGLPIKDADMVIVAIGEDQGASIMTTAVLKNLNCKKIVGRAISPLQENVIKAIGVDYIVHPEEEAAEHWTRKLALKNVLESFELDEEYSIIEIHTPAEFYGKKLIDLDIRKKYNLLVLTVLRKVDKKNIIGIRTRNVVTQGIAEAETEFAEGDILVLFGHNKSLAEFTKKYTAKK